MGQYLMWTVDKENLISKLLQLQEGGWAPPEQSLTITMELNFPIKIQFLSIATHLSPQKHFYYQEAVTLTEMELFQLNC